MVRAYRAIVSLGVLLLVGTSMAGCLEAVVFDPECAPTAVAATWDQPGAWDAFPDEGEHGPYNVSVLEQQGHVIVDPDWGELVADRIERTVKRDEENLSLVYRFNSKDTLSVVAPADLDVETVEEGFFESLQEVSPMEERELRPMIHELIRKDIRTMGGSTAQTQTDPLPDNDSMVEYTLQVEGPFRFETLYQDLLGRSGQEDRVHPWTEETVTLEKWSFHFPSPVTVAEHTREEGRFLQVDGLGHVAFHWDPPTGAGKEAIEAGISRTLMDLGLEPPADFDDVEVYTVTC